jgi:solute:Na+ symporter, SSS family
MKLGKAIPLSLFCLTFLASPLWGGQDPAPNTQGVTPGLRDRAVAALQNTFVDGQGSDRLRAAGYLIALDYREDVREALIDQLEHHAKNTRDKLGIWGVLARTDQGVDRTRRKWIENIRGVLLEADSPDRRQAIEVLCDLQYQLDGSPQDSVALNPERAAIAAFMARGDDSDRAMGWCLLLTAGDADAEANLAALLTSGEAEGRRDSARSLRRQAKIARPTWDALVESADREPADSPARVYLVAAAFKHAPDSRPGVRAELKREVLRYAGKGSNEDRREACIVLADKGTEQDVPLLAGLLDAADVGVDVRLAAANALCRIGRRHPAQIGGLDWFVIALYGSGMIAVGWYYSRRTSSAEDYLLGGRVMRPWAVGLSMFATLLSTISYLSYPGEVIRYGPMIISGIAVYPLIFLVVGYFMIPFIMKLKVTSAYEILESRLGLSIRMLGSLIFLTLRLLWMATIIYVTTSAVIIPILNWDESWTPVVCAILGLITVIYTSMGGLRAVVFTDVIQTFILFGGAILTMVLITVHLGGVGAWWPDHWLPYWPEPTWHLDTKARISFVGMMIAMFTWYVCTSGSDQMAIQRYLATRDAKAARRVLFIALASDAMVAGFLILLGLALLAYYTANPHFLPDGQSMVIGADKLFPRYIASGLPMGIRGLVIAGLLAAAMSSLSSGVNSSSSVIAIDFVERFRKHRLAEQKRVTLVKWISCLVGIAVVGLSLYVSLVPGNIVELAYRVVNLLVAPLFMLFFMAMFVPWATTFGTWSGAVVSTLVAILIAYWEPLSTAPGFKQAIAALENLFGIESISFLWIMPASLVTGIVLGSVFSLLPVGKSPKLASIE